MLLCIYLYVYVYLYIFFNIDMCIIEEIDKEQKNVFGVRLAGEGEKDLSLPPRLYFSSLFVPSPPSPRSPEFLPLTKREKEWEKTFKQELK